MKTILVSAGHSTVFPKDPGAVGNGYVEATEALKMRDAVADHLKLFDVRVIEDGIDGESEPLKKAVALARSADLAIEFHFNAGTPKATGIEVLAKPRNLVISQKIAQAINKATGLVLRGDKGWKADNSGQHHRLAFCEAGGVIVEICFISNSNDMQKYSANFNEIARNIAWSLAEYVGAKASPQLKSHTVANGETLFGIAKKYSIGLSWLKNKNGLMTDTIEIGQVLIIAD